MDMERFISTLARRFSLCYRLDYEDLMQEAEIMLLRAESAYRAKNGASFETYARACIRNRFMKLARHEKAYRRCLSAYAEARGLSRRMDREIPETEENTLAAAEEALPEHKRPLWEKYKELEGRYGTLSDIARLHGKSREWARQEMNGIFALLRDRLERQAGNTPARPAGEGRK